MEYLQEVTVWGDNTPNHTYIVNKAGQLAGYIKLGTTKEIMLTKPIETMVKKSKKVLKCVSVITKRY